MYKYKKELFLLNIHLVQEEYLLRREHPTRFIPFAFLDKKKKQWYLGLIDTRDYIIGSVFIAETNIPIYQNRGENKFLLQYNNVGDNFNYDTFEVSTKTLQEWLNTNGKVKFPLSSDGLSEIEPCEILGIHYENLEEAKKIDFIHNKIFTNGD